MADDDIDGLLAEVETAVQRKRAGEGVKVNATRAVIAGQTAQQQQRTTAVDIDKLLALTTSASTNSLSTIGYRAPITSHGDLVTPSLSRVSDGKCNPTFAGHEESSVGRGKAPCERLRCTSCDFTVVRFANASWRPGLEYMFFRERMPDRDALSSGLLHIAGCTAYACQCGWLSMAAGEGVKAIRRGALAVPLGASDWSESVASGRVGGSGWAHWACMGHT